MFRFFFLTFKTWPLENETTAWLAWYFGWKALFWRWWGAKQECIGDLLFQTSLATENKEKDWKNVINIYLRPSETKQGSENLLEQVKTSSSPAVWSVMGR